MTTEKVFDGPVQHVTTEDTEVFGSWVVDLCKQRGTDVVYAPKTQVVVDEILNEVSTSAFDHVNAFEVEMWPQEVDGQQVDNLMLTRVGLRAAPVTYTWVVSRDRFREEAERSPDPVAYEPRVGDLLIHRHERLVLEVRDVDEGPSWLGQGRSLAFTLRAEPWSYDGDTSVDVGEDVGADLGTGEHGGDLDAFLRGVEEEHSHDVEDTSPPAWSDVVVEGDR